jgi:hypothetical protein
VEYASAVDFAVYDGRDTTGIVQRVYDSWLASHPGQPFAVGISIESMGGDPQPGMPKSCAVLFRRWHRARPLNTIFAVVRSAGEGQSLVLDLSTFNETTAV